MTAGDFLRNLYTDLNAAEDRAKAFQAQAIGTQSAGLITIQRVESTLPDGEAYGRLKGFATADQDYVLCLEMRGGGTVVLGPLQNTAPAGYTLDAPLSVSGELVASAGLVNSDALFGVMPAVYADTASVASTGATATFQNVITATFTLPAGGTWHVAAYATVRMTRSPAGGANLQILVNTSVAGTSNPNPDVAIPTSHVCTAYIGPYSGGTAMTVTLQYKGSSGSGVTTTAAEPMLMPFLRRDS